MRTPGSTLAGCVLLTAVAVSACGTATDASPTSAPTVAPTVAPTSSLVPALTGQTDTDWGRIWDGLPADFPTYPGATPSEEAATGPYSANFAVNGANAKTVATWTSVRLTQAGYSVDGDAAVLEDGSYVLEATKGTDCRAQVQVAPLGSLTTITIRYGAACPVT